MTQKLPHAVMVVVQGDTAGGGGSMAVLAFGLVFVAMCQVMVESVHPAPPTVGLSPLLGPTRRASGRQTE
ncbi:MAG: hypothetical protein ACPIOQ_70640 [Promethearchaeia archaeon]